jgi:hypothetical protein
MSATVIPGLMPRSRTSWRGSPAASRSCSPCQIGLTISATGRSGFGKASAGAPDGAMKSWAAPSMVNVAVKPSAIAIRGELQAQRLRVSQLFDLLDPCIVNDRHRNRPTCVFIAAVSRNCRLSMGAFFFRR